MKKHEVTVRVRYGETDQMGVVYHANYLLYFETGRTELMRAAGLVYRDLEAGGVRLVVTEASCRYRAPARYDEELNILTRVASLGSARVRFEYGVTGKDGREIATGYTELASLDTTGRVVRLPAEVVKLLS